MTTRQRQYAACVKLGQSGYRAICGDSYLGPSVIVEHPDADEGGPEVIVLAVDHAAERY